MNKANECSCPSGDGSLVHPCPAHPAVEQAGGDERDFQAKGAQEVPSPVSKEYDRHLISLLRKGEALPGHQEEAADEIERLRDWNDHLNNTVLPNILNPNFLMLMKGGERLLDLCTKDGEFIGVSLNDMKDVFDWMVTHARIAPDQAALAQPSPAQAEQAEAERPEVFGLERYRVERTGQGFWPYCVRAGDGTRELFAGHLKQCKRVAAQLATAFEDGKFVAGALREQYECNTAIMHARTEALSRVTSERDAALSRVAELEKQEPVATVAKVPGEDWNSLDFHRDLQDMQPGTKLYAAPLAQAQQLHDLDKQCRDDVARARPNKERGFAWSYLLASIKSCVKASGDSAQAQHSVPEGWKLVPVEPTEDVLEAIHNGGYVGDDQELRWFYQSILAAAPAPGGE
ncbi:hypothetical protein L4P45_005870 [Pseudomonas aeruginosa]|nr:hypothetical protein [Pseudomonas aeruginosa]